MKVLILKGTINLVLIAVWIIFVIQAFSHIIVSLIATLIARVFTDLLIPMDSEN